ncbi:MAG TPA: hypothetical protein V6D28_06580 [Leptolyngbyaceae cyanobacterium]
MSFIHPGFLFFTACFLTGWSIFSLLHSILRISPFPSRITIVSLAIQGLIVFLILIGMLIITLVPNTVSQLTKSSPSALILLLGLLGVSALIGIIWVWF